MSITTNSGLNLTQKSEIEKLLSDCQCGIITSDDVSEKIQEMTRRFDILKKHETFCKIWQASDGRWKTKLPLEDNEQKKCKLVAKTNKEDLENYIVNWYREQQEVQKPCLESLYEQWIAHKEKETSMANANKLIYVWNKYYKDTSIVTIAFEDMTAGAMKDWFLTVISEKKLTSKQFKEMKSVVNMMYDYAISYNYTSTNIPRQVRGFSDRIFREDTEKPISETVYDSAAKNEVIKEALKQYEKTGNTAYLAVCLNFSLALRVGELVVLATSCINDDGTIDIIKEEVKTYIKAENGTMHRNGYEVVNHTKTQCGQRKLVLTPNAKKYIEMSIKRNKELGIADEDYIFLTKEGNRIHDYAVNNILRRLNGVRNERDAFVITNRPSGNHAIRKTCISELHDSMLLSDDTIKTFAGHKDISTTQKCYIHQVKPITDFANEFEKVFDAT